LLYFASPAYLPILPSFPTRRSSDLIRAKIDELKPFFPPGLEVVYPLDTTPFVRLSIEEVVHTLIEAFVLVFLVMYLFLQNFRARSEEHTSELQSRENLVCRLLLEKK